MYCLGVNYVIEWHYHGYSHYCLGKISILAKSYRLPQNALECFSISGGINIIISSSVIISISSIVLFPCWLKNKNDSYTGNKINKSNKTTQKCNKK